MSLSPGSGPIPLMGLLIALSLVPFAVMMLTSFSKMLVVLSLARSALGSQQAPPTLVLTGLAAVLTATVMSPVLERMYQGGQASWSTMQDSAGWVRGATRVYEPLREFLVKHGSVEERAHFVDLARELRPFEEANRVTDADWFVVIPAFVITELREAFQLGFLLFLPFLVLDMVIANVLMALGMQTLSPTQVSLPFKILLFVTVDGWSLIARGLVLGYR